MSDLLKVLLFLAVYVVATKWILPRLGFPT